LATDTTSTLLFWNVYKDSFFLENSRNWVWQHVLYPDQA
jgi:hypothetical protein